MIRRLETSGSGVAGVIRALERPPGAVEPEIARRVAEIVAAVRSTGDAALLDCTRRFDRVALAAADLAVRPEEYAAAARAVGEVTLRSLRYAADRIERFHRECAPRSWRMRDAHGSRLGQEVRPLDRVAVYVPGGRAAYPSTVLMTVVPARVAGVREIVLVSPPGADGSLNPAVLAAARIAGVTEAYRVGGAQAIAALAYGTASIRRVDKIVGPGNIYVALAKAQVFGDVGIDMVAGPSEVLVVADETADAEFVAADLLAQAEHDPMARAVLLTPSPALRDAVAAALGRQLAALPRREIAGAALAGHGALVLTASVEEAVELANAPRGGGVPGPAHAGGGGGLRGGAEPRAADRRHRALLLGALDRGFRNAAQRDRVFAGRAGRGGPARRGAVPRGGPRRTRRGGGGTHRGRAGGSTMTGQRSTEPAEPRQSRIERNTKETQIVLHLNLDGTGASKIDTGIPFFNHMLEAWSKHALMDLTVDAKGDLDVDLHHTVEDVGICLGKALREAVGDKKGIVRYGASFLPMDEALLHAAVDISGRPYLVFNVPLQRTRIANFDLDLLKDFFRAVTVNAEITLHLNMHYGENLHHIAEATFKAAGRALAEATRLNPRITGILSTKGSL